MKPYNEKDGQALWKRCQAFVKTEGISCDESIHQQDNVIENAYEFIERVCDIVGYDDSENEND